MSFNNASVPLGGTYSPTGGSAKSLVTLGTTPKGHKLFLDEGLAALLRKTVLISVKDPVPGNGPNGYTQRRGTFSLHSPILLDNGEVATNTITVTYAYDPETDASEIAGLREWLCHLGSDADFDGFFDDGSTA